MADTVDDLSLPEVPPRAMAWTTMGRALTDRVDTPVGPTLEVLDSYRRARERLIADVERCRYLLLPDHRCTTRDGAPLNEGQVCHYEAKAQLLEGGE